MPVGSHLCDLEPTDKRGGNKRDMIGIFKEEREKWQRPRPQYVAITALCKLQPRRDLLPELGKF
jgi:hypothetical protein